MTITDQQSQSFWALKAIAIFTVFFAHMPGHSYNAVIFDKIGLLGVPLFMICAGFFYDVSKKTSLKSFLGKKWHSMIIPLLIWGTITYLIHILKTHDADILSYLKWIVGIGTWLYFVPVLFCCQILSRYVNRVVLIVLGLASMSLSYFGLIPYNEVFTPYINPFNFIAYFTAGNYLRTYDKWLYIRPKRGALLLIVSIVLIVLLKPVYWHPHSLVLALTLFLALFTLLQVFNLKCFVGIGKLSFVIYLSHIQVAGIVNQLARQLWGTPLEFVKVIIAFVAVAILGWCLQWLLRRFKLDSLREALGFR